MELSLEVNWQTAKQLFRELAGASFVTDQGTRAPIPFHYPPDGCYARAHLMARLLTEKGYASEKVFAISTHQQGLEVASNYAADMPAGQQNRPTVRWWYHVAPIIKVTIGRNLVDMVIDPSMAKRPITIDQWTGMMSSGKFNRLSLAQVQQQLQQNGGDYQSNQRLTFTTDRNTYGPYDLNAPTDATAEANFNRDRSRISNYALRAQVHELAAAIRGQLQQRSPKVPRIISVIRRATPLARQNLWNLFPNLHTEMQARFSRAQMARIELALTQ